MPTLPAFKSQSVEDDVYREYFPDLQAWAPTTLQPDQWRRPWDDACLAELAAVVEALRRNPKPAEQWSASDFDLPACKRGIAEARKVVDVDTGFVVLSRIPIERYTKEESRTLYWILAQLVDRPMPQYLEQAMIFDLRHTGDPRLDNEQGMRVKTDELLPHSDESLLDYGPRYVSLFCLSKAKEGGETRLSSFYRAHNRMLAAEPDLLARLYTPFFWLPARPTPVGALYYHPVVRQLSDHLRFQHSEEYVHIGYRHWGKTLDEQGRKALARLTGLLIEEQFGFILEPGEMTFFHNDKVAHGRSAHTDHPEVERKRHLLRLWLGRSGSEYPIPPEIESLRTDALASAVSQSSVGVSAD